MLPKLGVFWVSHNSANAIYEKEFELTWRTTNTDLKYRTSRCHLLQTLIHPSRSTKQFPSTRVFHTIASIPCKHVFPFHLFYRNHVHSAVW